MRGVGGGEGEGWGGGVWVCILKYICVYVWGVCGVCGRGGGTE